MKASSPRTRRPPARAPRFDQCGLDQKGSASHSGKVKVEAGVGRHAFDVQVSLPDLDPKTVRVEFYAGELTGVSPMRKETKRIRLLVDASDGRVYSAVVFAARTAGRANSGQRWFI